MRVELDSVGTEMVINEFVNSLYGEEGAVQLISGLHGLNLKIDKQLSEVCMEADAIIIETSSIKALTVWLNSWNN
ncbi:MULTISPECIES: hypothetical protein [Nitrincola]|uniref:Uncharacterized protein n=1 Tax=Nitrincola nitratireducens TaxID=1229521 RepID=W9VN28_9GAMM|nr:MULTISPECIES: hypothetical protein [Nitrincola]EXJ11900.1 hypothetical protein D791_01273 [Nitrincola nitratireducens]